MSKPNIQEWSDDKLIEACREWEVDSVQEFNKLADQPIENFRIASNLITNLCDDNRFLLGVVAELARRVLKRNPN